MEKQNEMLELFQVEELEKRYEMGWAPSTGSAKGGANHNGPYVELQVNWNFN